MGSGGRGWDAPPQFPSLNNPAALSRPPLTYPAPYSSRYPPPYHGAYPSQQLTPYGTWGLTWALPSNYQQPPPGIPIPQEGMEVNDSTSNPETPNPTTAGSQQQEKKKDKGKRRATSREMREQTDKERQEGRQELNHLLRELDREGATLDDNDDIMDGLCDRNRNLEDWNAALDERNKDLEAEDSRTQTEPQQGNSRPQGLQLIIPGLIRPPKIKIKDPALIEYTKPRPINDNDEPDSTPSSPDLEGLPERQQKKKKQELKDKGIPGRTPDTLGVVKITPGCTK
ncbi:hypothetical protein BDQ17DRAFT_1334002 [Cyathus striatus]|nr:hypothetical protein BDQ17DRAFT_1334002 [Cyathus striatus]